MSFVILAAYAPAPAVSGDAGAAQLPLLLNPHVSVAQEDPEVPWNDHSPDLLLAWLDHTATVFAGSAFEDHAPAALAFADHSAVNFSLTDHSPASVAFTDHTPD